MNEKDNVLDDSFNNYKKEHNLPVNEAKVSATSIPTSVNFDPEKFQTNMSKETDPDLIVGFEIIKLPSKGLFYKNKISELVIEYLTSKDEDILTTPSLIENGTVLDVVLKRKIKTQGILPEDLLSGDRDAIILFLRTSSYGVNYKVQVTDPRNDVPFKTEVDLRKLEYKEVKELPDEAGLFSVELPMRKKLVKFRLLKSSEENLIIKKADAIKETYNTEYNEYNTLKLKTQIVEINGRSDRTYIDKFIDAMPALDAYTIRKKIQDVSPGVNMRYEFQARDGYKFFANLTVGVDFFFPNT